MIVNRDINEVIQCSFRLLNGYGTLIGFEEAIIHATNRVVVVVSEDEISKHYTTPIARRQSGQSTLPRILVAP